MAKKYQVPLGDTGTPLKDSPALKFQKSSASRKYTTSKFSLILYYFMIESFF